MPQHYKKVSWCLDKAARELKERGVHRGLVRTEPNSELADRHITKAGHNLKAALHFYEAGYSDWSASAFFYCIYHCFLSILSTFGYESRNQECTIAMIESLKEEKLIHLDDALISALKAAQQEDLHEANVIELREKFQYGVELEFGKKERFEELVVLCKNAVHQAREIIHP